MSHGSEPAARAGAAALNRGMASAAASRNAVASRTHRRVKAIESMCQLPFSGTRNGRANATRRQNRTTVDTSTVVLFIELFGTLGQRLRWLCT